MLCCSASFRSASLRLTAFIYFCFIFAVTVEGEILITFCAILKGTGINGIAAPIAAAVAG